MSPRYKSGVQGRTLQSKVVFCLEKAAAASSSLSRVPVAAGGSENGTVFDSMAQSPPLAYRESIMVHPAAERPASRHDADCPAGLYRLKAMHSEAPERSERKAQVILMISGNLPWHLPPRRRRNVASAVRLSLVCRCCSVLFRAPSHWAPGFAPSASADGRHCYLAAGTTVPRRCTGHSQPSCSP